MTDSDAWKQNISAIVNQKNQGRTDAAEQEQIRVDHVSAEYEKARGILRDEPEAGFQEFAAYLQLQGESASVRHGLNDDKGPWIGIDISDKHGLIVDVILKCRLRATGLQWFWVYEHRGSRRQPKEQGAEIRETGPSKQYVIDTLAEYYLKASTTR